jgi:hypothetical protein
MVSTEKRVSVTESIGTLMSEEVTKRTELFFFHIIEEIIKIKAKPMSRMM